MDGSNRVGYRFPPNGYLARCLSCGLRLNHGDVQRYGLPGDDEKGLEWGTWEGMWMALAIC